VKIVTEKVSTLVNVLKMIHSVDSDCFIIINENELVIGAMESNQVSSTFVKIKKEFFTEFEFNPEEDEDMFVVHSLILKKVFGKINDTSTVFVEISNKKNEGLFKVSTSGVINKKYTLPLIAESRTAKLNAIKSFSQGIGKLKEKLEVSFEMDLKVFNESVDGTDILLSSDDYSVFINMLNGKFSISVDSVGGTGGLMDFTMAKYETPDGSSRYSFERLKKYGLTLDSFNKKGDFKFIVSFKKDYPIIMETSQSDFNLIFVIAPRLDNNNE